MRKFFLIVLLFIPVILKAGEELTFEKVDSITYQYYLTGEWDKLIETGNQAILQKIDFKRLRQRMGYAYFIKTEYFAAQKHFKKALEFDKNDSYTKEYLYYCSLYTGNGAFARFNAGNLPQELKTSFGIKRFEPVSSFDLEYNYKYNTSSSRSNPSYFRVGFQTELGYRVALYQSVSGYRQTIDTSLVKQPEYFGLLKWCLTSRTSLSLAYHYLSTNFDGSKYNGNLVFAALSTHVNHFTFGLNGSYFTYNQSGFTQIDLYTGVYLQGKANFYLNTYLSGLIHSNSNRLVYSQYAGVRVYKNVWVEALVVLGNLSNYNDHNALYIYNSIDPTVFRTGFSLYWHAGEKITFYGNYLFDTKQIEQSVNTYIQQSFLGGIIWKH